MGNSVNVPGATTREILFPDDSVNHIVPSGPAAIPSGKLAVVGTEYSAIEPSVLILPILFAGASVNQSVPSVPATIFRGPLAAVGVVNSVKRSVQAPVASQFWTPEQPSSSC